MMPNRFIEILLRACIVLAANLLPRVEAEPQQKPQPRAYSIPVIDISDEEHRQVVIDKDPDHYLGHPTTALLEDHKTMIIVYPEGHGRGCIIMKRSYDAGLTWSLRLPTPKSWASSLEVPTIHRVIDAHGFKRLILFSGLYPCRMAVSEDDGNTWSELQPVGDWGGIVQMASLLPLNSAPGRYLAMFHDDRGFFKKDGKQTDIFTIYKTFSDDGGLTWSFPLPIYTDSQVHLCEPGVVRSPDGRQLAALLRENSRRRNSYVIFSSDEGKNWSEPRELPGALTGDRHVGKYASDGRLFISFRDTTHESSTRGDWVGWVGTYEDIAKGRQGQYRVRLKENNHSHAFDCGYPALELLPGGMMVATTYGHWTPNHPPYIINTRFKMNELDAKARISK